MSTVHLGPWPLGMDNVHVPSHRVFQPPGQGQSPARLLKAINVNLDDEGWPQARPDTALVGAAIQSARSYVGDLIHAGDALLNSSRSVVAHVSGDVAWVEHGMSLYYSDGAQCGRVEAGVAANWGCAVAPTPRLSATSGTLLAGDYLVAVAYLDAFGIEHGADVAGNITLSASGGISASVQRIDSNAVGCRWYLAGPHGEALYWVGDTAGFTATITQPASTTIVCDRVGLMPPLPATALFSWRDYVLLGAGQDIYPSVGQAVHLFEPAANAMRFPQPVIAGAGLADGFYVVTRDQLYWVSGGSAREWQITEIGRGVQYAQGAFKCSAAMLPALQLQSTTEVAVFASSRGLVVGPSGGQAVFPTTLRVHFDVIDKRAHFAVDDYRLYMVLK